MLKFNFKQAIMLVLSLFMISCSSGITGKVKMDIFEVGDDVCCEGQYRNFVASFMLPDTAIVKKGVDDTLNAKEVQKIKSKMLKDFKKKDISVSLRIFDSDRNILTEQLNITGTKFFDEYCKVNDNGKPWRFLVPFKLDKSRAGSVLSAQLIFGDDVSSKTFNIGGIVLNNTSSTETFSVGRTSSIVNINFDFEKASVEEGEPNKLIWNITKPAGSIIQLSTSGGALQNDRDSQEIYPKNGEVFSIKVIKNNVIIDEKKITAVVTPKTKDFYEMTFVDKDGNEQVGQVYEIALFDNNSSVFLLEEGNAVFQLSRFDKWKNGQNIETPATVALVHLFSSLNDRLANIKGNKDNSGKKYYIFIRGVADYVSNPETILRSANRNPIEQDIISHYNSSQYLNVFGQDASGSPVSINTNQVMNELQKEGTNLKIGGVPISPSNVIPNVGYNNNQLPNLRAAAIRYLYMKYFNSMLPTDKVNNLTGIKIGLINGFVTSSVESLMRTISVNIVAFDHDFNYPNLLEID